MRRQLHVDLRLRWWADEKLIRQEADEGTHLWNQQLRRYSQGQYHNATIVGAVKPKLWQSGKCTHQHPELMLLGSTSCEERRVMLKLLRPRHASIVLTGKRRRLV